MAAVPTPGAVPPLNVQVRLDDLKAKLAAREGRPGFARNARHLRGEIARLEQEASNG